MAGINGNGGGGKESSPAADRSAAAPHGGDSRWWQGWTLVAWCPGVEGSWYPSGGGSGGDGARMITPHRSCMLYVLFAGLGCQTLYTTDGDKLRWQGGQR